MLRRSLAKLSQFLPAMSGPSSAKRPQPVVQPPVHRGLAVIDRSLFSLSVPLLAARVPTALTTQYRRDELKK